MGSSGSVFTSRPGTRKPSQAQAMKNGFVEGSAEAARRLPAKTSAAGKHGLPESGPAIGRVHRGPEWGPEADRKEAAATPGTGLSL